MTKIKGIDVSEHQGTIDWKKVALSGVKFVVLREGYRKTIDSKFLDNVKGAKANNIEVMLYHFIYTNGATLKQNAESTVKSMKKAGLDPTTTWVFADLEYDTWKRNGKKCTRALCTQYTQEYIDALKKLGCKKIGIYMNIDYHRNYYTSEIIKKYPVWLADYSGNPDYKCVMQQYSSSGKVNGIKGNVDMNYLFDSSLINKEVTHKPVKIKALSRYSYVFSGSSIPNKVKQFDGKVSADVLNVRVGAGTEYSKCSFSPLKKGNVVSVCDAILSSKSETWYYIKYNNKYGFVHSDYIKL